MAKSNKSKKGSMNRVSQAILIVGLGLVVGLLLISRLSFPGNIKFLVVQSGSMEPTIKVGSVVMIKPSKSYEPGEVITFSKQNNQVPITHRVTEAEVVGGRTQFLTKGDANENSDMSPVPMGRVLGKVLLSVPYVGYGVAAAKTPWGFIFIVVVPALLIIFEEVNKIRIVFSQNKTKPAIINNLIIDLREGKT